MPSPARPSVAVVSSRYPSLSETFVYREVEALRALGWTVWAVSLRAANGASELLRGVDPADLVIYRAGSVVDALLELARHPLRTAGTLAGAIRDALQPGEPTPLRTRLALLAQAVAGLAAARRLRARGVRHLHCHFAHAPTGVGMYAARQIPAGFSFVGHANDLFENRALLRRKLERATFVSCISEWHRAWYRELVPGAADRLHLIRCGVELERFRDHSGEAPAAGGAPLRVLSVARLVPKKGLDLLVRALAGSDLDWRLDVGGDGPERERLEALCLELDVAERVRMHGALHNDRVVALMAHADVFALPCRVAPGGDRDGIPVVLMEAMASGLPVVAGDLPTLRELVRPGETGLLFPEGDVPALRACLVELARDPALRARLARAGRARVETEFATSPNALRLDRVLRAALRPA